MRRVVYDAGALIAADRSDRRMWAEHRVRLESGVLPAVPAPVVAQVSRSPRQVQLRRLLAGTEVVPFEERDGHAVGRLLSAAKTSDVLDGAVVHPAMKHQADVVTSDPRDLTKLATAVGARMKILPV